FFEGDVQGSINVAASTFRFGPGAAPFLPHARAPDLEPEIAEDVFKKASPEPVFLDSLEDAAEIRSAEDVLLAELLIDSRMAVLVIQRPLLWIREHPVRLGYFLELVLCFFLFLRGDAVGMRAQRELPVSLLQLFRCRAFPNAQDFVVVACCRHLRALQKSPQPWRAKASERTDRPLAEVGLR